MDSIHVHEYVCKHNVDEKRIVLVLLNWTFSRADMFGSHTCVCVWGGGRGHYFNWRSQYNYLGDLLYKLDILLLFRLN